MGVVVMGMTERVRELVGRLSIRRVPKGTALTVSLPRRKLMAFEPLTDKLKAFGWFTQRVDGNDLDAVVAAFDAAKANPDPKPSMIIADT